jgi:hypothetical protein
VGRIEHTSGYRSLSVVSIHEAESVPLEQWNFRNSRTFSCLRKVECDKDDIGMYV